MASSSTHKLCMIPGPVEFEEDVLLAMKTPATSHVSPSFIEIFGQSLEMLRSIIFSKHAQPFIIAGSGTLGWDMTACNVVEAGESVLVLNTGLFGDRFGECLATYGAKVTHLRANTIGDRPSLEEIEKALTSATTPYKLVTITHVDTSTGVLSDIKSMAALVKAISPSTLIAVDGVCSVAVEEIRMDEWNIDIVLTASQKAIGVPPGLCILFANPRAIDAFNSRKTPVPSYYANWKKWIPIMKAYEDRKPLYFATPAVQLIMALHVSLKQILSAPGGMEERFRKHIHASNLMKDRMESLGLRMVPLNRSMAANGMTALYYPSGIAATSLLPKITGGGVVVAGGLHPDIATQYFRVGHMNISATNLDNGHLDKTIKVIIASLNECGYSQ